MIKPFGKLAVEDQAVVREVMERIYLEIDQASITDNTEALSALVKHGLERVAPNAAEIPKWTQRVVESNRALAENGVISRELQDEMLGHLAEFRAR